MISVDASVRLGEFDLDIAFENDKGIVALFGLTAIYQEADAPRLLWLNLLAAIALLRVLPAGRFRQWIEFYRRVALLALLVIGGLFAVQQVRSALYPQLEPFVLSPTALETAPLAALTSVMLLTGNLE